MEGFECSNEKEKVAGKNMVTSCAIVGCTNKRKEGEKCRFFRLPNVINTDEESEKLSKERRELWIARIKRQNLSKCQLAEKDSTLHVCSHHFESGQPSKLFE